MKKKIFIVVLSLFVCGVIVFETNHYFRHEARKNRRILVSLSGQWKTLVPKSKKQVVDDAVGELLRQPFFYLGHGRQTYVFKSSDGSCVLKLFKNVAKKKKIRRVREGLLGAYLAQEKLAEETGIIFCSIAGVKGKRLPVTLLNKKGNVETVDLSTTPFVLQRTVKSLKETLLRLRAEGRLQEAQECVHSIFNLLLSCREKQIVDRDGALIRNGNIGLLGTRALLIDTGKLCVLSDPKKQTLHDLNRLRPLFSWCKEAYPELLPMLKECRKAYSIIAAK